MIFIIYDFFKFIIIWLFDDIVNDEQFMLVFSHSLNIMDLIILSIINNVLLTKCILITRRSFSS